MWYYLREIWYFFLFLGFLGFPINRMICLLFSKMKIWEEYNTKTFKIQKKRVRILRYNNPCLLKGFRIFLAGSSCGLPLEAEYVDDL